MRKYILFLGCATVLFSCSQKEPLSEFPEKSAYEALGDSISQITFDTLSSTMKNKMQESGPVGALRFCNTKAIQLTGLYTSPTLVSVKRSSSKIRNVHNKPDEWELAALKKFEANPGITRISEKHADGTIRYYRPIIIMENCLKCHGNPETFSDSLKSTLHALYPGDKAINYKPGELRGIWSLTFKPESNF